MFDWAVKSGRRLTQNTLAWQRLLLISGLLILAIAIPLNSLQNYALLLLGLLPGIGALLMLLRWPAAGPVAVIVSALLVPFAISTGTNTSINASIILVIGLFALWLLAGIQHREWNIPDSRPYLPLLVLVVVAITAFIVGNQSLISFAQTAPLPAQLGGLGTFILSAMAFFVVAVQIRELCWLQIMTWVFLALGSLYVLGQLVPMIPIKRFLIQEATGSLLWTWMVAMAMGQAVFNRQLDFRWRIILGLISLGAVYTAYNLTAGGWKSGWMPALVCLAVIFSFRFSRLAIVGSLIVLTLVPGFLSGLVATDEYSASTRLEAWQIIGEIVKTNPVLGLGPANYYWYTPLYSIRGFYVQFNSHNQYVDLVAQTGVLGILAFFWFVWEVGRLGWHLISRAPVGFAQAYVYGALAGLAGTLVAGVLGDWFIPFVYNVGLGGFRASVLGWLFLGGLVVIQRTIRRPEARLSR